MEKNGKRTKRSSIIIYILSISIILTLSYLTYNNIDKINKQNKIKKSINPTYKKLEKEYNKFSKDKEEVEKEIKELSDMDSKINVKKEEVFKLAKQVEEKIQKKETNKKIAYITFDDGPYALTDNVLAKLKEHKVKATFFTIGYNKDTCFDNRNKSCAETYKKIVDNNHTIANHTYSHAIFYGLYSSSDEFINQVEKQEQLIKERTGVKTNILRFPGGMATAGRLKNEITEKLRERGYGWVDWTAQDGDGGEITSTDQAWRIFKNSIDENIEVILFHDYNEFTYAILDDAINYLESNDYILLPLFYDSVMIQK